jgi:hypothetical protein
MTPPGSGTPPKLIGFTQTCTPQGGQLDFSVNKSISGSTLDVQLLNTTTLQPLWQSGFGGGTNQQAFTVPALADGVYRLAADNGEAYAFIEDIGISCGVVPGGLTLAVSKTDETAAGPSDGTITLTPAGGTDPLTLEVVGLGLSRQTTGGTPELFTAIPPGTYPVQVSDSGTPQMQASSSVTVLPYVPAVNGCQDEYADNYEPAATTGGYASCTYTPLWRSAWQPMAVRVAAVAGQLDGFISAELRIGFRPGHPLAADRPLGAPLELRATVGPDGYATFVLGPYLRPELGAPDGAGGYRYDLNSPTAYDADLFVGYELRRAVSDELLEHGYALNSAVPDAQILNYLNPFYLAGFPVWPGFSDYIVTRRGVANGSGGVGLGDYGVVYTEPADGGNDIVQLPCPPTPLPVRWLAPGGGYGYWVFQGRTQFGDSVGEGQAFREASSGQQRYSDPGDAYQTFKASSGVFKGEALLAGLRTLWRSPQAWVQLEPGGEWVPIFIPRGDRDVARVGIRRQELVLNFSLAAPEWAQGQ